MRSERRCIPKLPKTPIWYLVDTCCLVNKYLDAGWATDQNEKDAILSAQEYWRVIDQQLGKRQCKIFLLDVCIAEAFRVLAKKRYQSTPFFKSKVDYNRTCDRMSKDLSLGSREAKRMDRNVQYHDIQTCSDIIIEVDRFFEAIFKRGGAGLRTVDLMLLSTGKYLMDYYGITKEDLFLITQDKELYRIARTLNDLPKAFNPQDPKDNHRKVFTT